LKCTRNFAKIVILHEVILKSGLQKTILMLIAKKNAPNLFSCCIKLVEQNEVIKSLERRLTHAEREVVILKGQNSSLDQVDVEGGDQAPLQIYRLGSTMQGCRTSRLY
jgi:hypothetical protein